MSFEGCTQPYLEITLCCVSMQIEFFVYIKFLHANAFIS